MDIVLSMKLDGRLPKGLHKTETEKKPWKSGLFSYAPDWTRTVPLVS